MRSSLVLLLMLYVTRVSAQIRDLEPFNSSEEDDDDDAGSGQSEANNIHDPLSNRNQPRDFFFKSSEVLNHDAGGDSFHSTENTIATTSTKYTPLVTAAQTKSTEASDEHPPTTKDSLQSEPYNVSTETNTAPVTTMDNVTCIADCETILEDVELTISPKDIYIQSGINVTLTCTVHKHTNTDVELIWLYQTSYNSQPCSMDAVPYLPSCQGFIGNREIYLINRSAVVSELDLISPTPAQTGHYSCQALVTCCSKPGGHQHSFNNTLTGYIRIYKPPNYLLHILILAAVILGMLCLVALVVFLRWRAGHYTEPKAEHNVHIAYQPVLEPKQQVDTASLDSFEDYTPTSSPAHDSQNTYAAKYGIQKSEYTENPNEITPMTDEIDNINPPVNNEYTEYSHIPENTTANTSNKNPQLYEINDLNATENGQIHKNSNKGSELNNQHEDRTTKTSIHYNNESDYAEIQNNKEEDENYGRMSMPPPPPEAYCYYIDS